MCDESQRRLNEDNVKKISKLKNDGFFSILGKALNVYKCLLDKIKSQSKHMSCPHSNSCVHYILTVCNIPLKILDIYF